MQWFNENNDILVESIEDLMRIANAHKFGENENQSLASFLMTQAFDCRFDQSRSRAFRLAAKIISSFDRLNYF
jgi:hypothetical protein